MTYLRFFLVLFLFFNQVSLFTSNLVHFIQPLQSLTLDNLNSDGAVNVWQARAQEPATGLSIGFSRSSTLRALGTDLSRYTAVHLTRERETSPPTSSWSVFLFSFTFVKLTDFLIASSFFPPLFYQFWEIFQLDPAVFAEFVKEISFWIARSE